MRADIADVAQAVAAVEATVDRHGRIDALVNAAGLTTRGTLLDTTPELFDRHIAVNLRAPFFLMQAAVADMKQRGAPGTIVNVISIDSHGGQSFLAPVRRRQGRARRTHHATPPTPTGGTGSGSTVSTWAGRPPTVRTPTQRQAHGADDDWQRAAGAKLPMGKLGQVDEIADFVAFLLSDRSGVVTGSVIDWDQNVIGGLGD